MVPSRAHTATTPAAPPAAVAEGALRFQRPEPPPLEDVQAYYRLSQEAGFFANGGPCATLLESRLAARLRGAEVVPTASGTAGLLLALRAVLGEPSARRRRVLTPSFTFTATACAIAWAGFEPVFVDIDPDAWQLCPDRLERALAGDRRVAGVLACSTFGCAAPGAVRAAWRDACARAGVPLVIDSAAAFGSVDEDGEPVGGLGDTEVFSFHATKPFAVGEGGAVATPDPGLAARMRALANFGMAPGTRVSERVGINGKLSEIAAATGLAMLDRYEDVLGRRRATAAALRARLSGLPIAWQRGSEGSTWQILQGTVPSPAGRDACLEAAEALGVQARSYFDPPLHRHPAFAGAERSGDLRVTEGVARRSLSLPMANRLEDDEMERIADVVRRGLAPC